MMASACVGFQWCGTSSSCREQNGRLPSRVLQPRSLSYGRSYNSLQVRAIGEPGVVDDVQNQQDARTSAPTQAGINNVVPFLVGEKPGFDGRDWAAAFNSQPGEFDYVIDEIEGSIPAQLTGTLFRNGPANFQRGDQKYAHMLDGDGYVSRFTFTEDGEVHFRSRYVRTRDLMDEEKAGRLLYRSTFGTQRAGGGFRNAFDLKLKNPANTNVLLWGDKLLALWEVGILGCPYALAGRIGAPMLSYIIGGLDPSWMHMHAVNLLRRGV
jgi:hypothetical protein